MLRNGNLGSNAKFFSHTLKTPCRGLGAFVSKPLLYVLCSVFFIIIGLWVLLGFFFLTGTPVEPATKAVQIGDSPLIPKPTSERSSRFVDELVENSWQAVSESPAQGEGEPSPPDEPWQAAINSILTEDAEPVVLSKKLALALHGMPLEGQLEAAQHMVNLLGDEEYVTAESIYFHSGMPEQVRRLVFEDFMNRPNTLKLPLLVRTLREYGHPLRGEALENLQVYIGRDEGDDPNRWDAAVRETLDRERREQEAIAAEQGQSP